MMYQSVLRDNYDDRTGAEVNEEVVDYQRDTKIGIYNWTTESTRLLIGLRTNLDAEFENPLHKNMDLWKSIAGILNDHGFDFPPQICEKKWRNLKVYFRRTLSRGNEGRINGLPYRWEFYNDMFQYWKTKDTASFEPLEMEQGGGDYGTAEENMEDSVATTIGASLGVDMEGEEEDQFDNDEDQKNGECDTNKFLVVTLSDSEEDGGAVEEAKPMPDKVNRSGNIVLTHPTASGSGPVQGQSRNLSELCGSERARTFLIGRSTVAIEKVAAKRNLTELEQEDEVPFKLSTASGGLSISVRNRDAPGIKQARFEVEPDDLSPPAWFGNHIKQAAEREQKRWEENKALRLRELEMRRDLDLQKIQAMNRLTSAIVSFLHRTDRSD